MTQGFGGGEGLVDDGSDDGSDDDAEVFAPPVPPAENQETAGFVVVRPPIGARCEPDDDAPLRSQDAAEARWRELASREAESDADDEGDGDEDGNGNGNFPEASNVRNLRSERPGDILPRRICRRPPPKSVGPTRARRCTRG